VSTAMRLGSRFLELQLCMLLRDEGELQPHFPLKQACRQAFAAMQANARPHTTTPGFEAAKAKWQALQPAGYNGVRLWASNSLTYETNAFFSTLLCNFTKIALPAHVFWTLRFVAPTLWSTLKKAVIQRKPEALEDLPLTFLPLIAECHTIQDADFSEELAVRAINLRWKCLGIMDTVGPVHHVLGPRGVCSALHPKRFHLVPQCRRAARFITLDKQWARLALGLQIKPKDSDVVFPDENHLRYLVSGNPAVRKWCRSAKMAFPATVRTDGVQLHVPFDITVPEGELEEAKDRQRRDPDVLRHQLDGPRPHGLFHIEAARGLGENHPSARKCVGVDPGVKNLVTTSKGVKITRQQFYGARRPRQIFDPGSLVSLGKHSRATRENKVPAAVDEQQRVLCASTKAEGQDLGRFEVNLTAWLRCAGVLQTYYGSRTQRSIRLVQAARKRANMAWVVHAIAPDPATVVLFGANFAGRQCVKGDVAGPVVVKGIRRALAKERVVVMVDEFNTTKCHVVCGSVLSAHREDRREKWCDVCRCAVDRDGNASLNLESVWPHYLVHRTRPAHLCRGL
jgi:hypothetical protein